MKNALVLLLLALAAALASHPAGAQGSAARGQRWEQTINTGTTYGWTSKLCVSYTSPTGKVYTGAGFWDTRTFQPAPTPDTDVFKIRAAFNETGTWSWQLLNNAAAGCIPTAGLTPASGTVSVSDDTTGLPLYASGPVRVATSSRFLQLSGAGVLSPFLWIGDTTWRGAHRTFLNPGWNSYVADRKNKSYTVIQISVPREDADQPADVVSRKPFGFYDANDVLQPCTPPGALPRAACVPNKAFWDGWDRHVDAINDNGMLAAVIGLFKRTYDSSTWPTVADSRGYGRWVAARLAGNQTALSPGFDEAPKSSQTFNEAGCGSVTNGAENQACRARQVGAAIREAILLQTAIDVPALPATRQGAPLSALVTHHMGGGCPSNDQPGGMCLTDYWLDKFQDETWLDFQLFQSGQGGNCPAPKTQLQCLTERSSVRPLFLYNLTPVKPIINGEAIYDNNGRRNCAEPNALYGELRARQAAFNSLLSGAVGFTHGVGGTWDWNGDVTCRTVAQGTNAESSTQIGRLRQLLQPTATFRWNRLVPDCQAWGSACTDVKNADQATLAQHLKRMFARDSLGNFAIGFLPDNQGTTPFEPSLKLDLSDLAGFTPDAPWSTEWYNPRRPVSAGGPCTCTATATPSGSTYTFTRPAVGDWGLVIRNTTIWPTLTVPACNPPDGSGKIPC